MKKLKNKLDKVFSVYIRTRFKDHNAMVKCFTCGKFGHWGTMHCGHYISRRFLSTRWDEKNCQVQCPACNLYQEGNKNSFALRLMEKYGQTILLELEAKKQNICRMGKFEYEQLIVYFQKKIL